MVKRTNLRVSRTELAAANGKHTSDCRSPALTKNASLNENAVPPTKRRRNDGGLVCVGWGSSIGMDPVRAITIHYTHDDALIRFRPRLDLRDLDDCMFVPILNLSLAEKLQSIEVFANGYKLVHIGQDNFLVDRSQFKSPLPDVFTPDELADPWVRIRPSNGSSAFHLPFMSATPRRMFGHEEVPDVRTGRAS